MILTDLTNKLNRGEKVGITSVCSANRFVIEAAMVHAKENQNCLLIESTSNQVDQFGGYTGMTPKIFKEYVTSIAGKIDFPRTDFILGGDHLGPNVWKNQSVDEAMINAQEQIKAYAGAGYTKFHLDTSFALENDKTINGLLAPEVIAERASLLCKVCEESFNESKDLQPYYVIGTDVPIPGGAIDDEEEIKITNGDELDETIQVTKEAFYKNGLNEAWERVIAVVVQPGVEFSDSKILQYSREKNENLIKKIESYKGLSFEAHSTDYQRADLLRNMVEDHFAILKVGPWLTYALREALFALTFIENELVKYYRNITSSNLIQILESEMIKNPKYWKDHYKGDDQDIHYSLKYSYSDRIRYYWSNFNVDEAVNRLISNLHRIKIPESLVSQFLPKQYAEIRSGRINNNPVELIHSKIMEILSIYSFATGGNIEK